MNDHGHHDPGQPDPQVDVAPSIPEPKIVGYCRACGKSLDELSARTANGTIFCHDHVPAQPPPLGGLNTSAAPPPIATAPYTAPYVGPGASSPNAGSPYTGSPYTSSRIANPSVSPVAAFFLGLIPGVGAIYNGQYAKGIVHALVLGVLLTAANSSIPGLPDAVSVLLVISFWAYMPFEAYHTARLRREGQVVDEFSGLSGSASATRFPAAAVLLIVFGIVFLLNNLDMLDLRRILRFWPALMIGFGVYLLWMRLAAGNASAGKPGEKQ